MVGKGAQRTGRTPSSPSFLLVVSFLLALGSMPLSAFSFAPITQDFDPSGAGSIQTFRVENEGADPIAVRISMLSRTVDQTGRETNTPADAQFVLYPSRVVLAAGSAQSVRVQWKGPSDPAVELCYRILVEQLPVDFGGAQQQKGSIRVLFRYLGAIYIVPPGSKPDIELESADPATDAGGRPGLLLVFANRGKAHAILNEMSVTVRAGASGATEERTFGPQELAGINGENILPQGTRQYFLLLPDGFPKDDLHVAFRFDAIR